MKEREWKPKKYQYLGIEHKSIGKTYCPFCKSAQGTPCKIKDPFMGWRYTKTHMARVRLAKKLDLEERGKMKNVPLLPSPPEIK